MHVIYEIDPYYSSSVLEGMLDKACRTGIREVVVYIPTYNDESYVQAINGVTMQGNHLFKYLTLNGVIVTKQTIKNTKQPFGFVIAVGIDVSNLQIFEDRSDVKGVVLINDDIANIDEWLKLYDATDANTGQTRMQGMQVPPLLNRIIGWLKHISEGSTPLYDFKREDYLREAANLLKRNGAAYSADAVATQCIKRGLDARSARAVANVFGKALTTKGDMPLKVGKPDYDKMLAMVDDELYERN